MDAKALDRVRERAPLIHNITNYVTANDVANILLACGASPIMSDEPLDIAQITARCDGLHINLGTLHADRIEGMLTAGRTANAKGIPVVLDPVGVGASTLRRETAARLLGEVRFAAIRCNVSELRALVQGSDAQDADGGRAMRLERGDGADAGQAACVERGVDADGNDRIGEGNLAAMADFAREASKKLGCIVALTGAIDLATDGDRCFAVRNGRSEMRAVTGTGCQLSALLAAYLAANPENPLESAVAALCAMGLAGELAWGRMQPGDGNATYRCRIIDAIYNMTREVLEGGARYDVR